MFVDTELYESQVIIGRESGAEHLSSKINIICRKGRKAGGGIPILIRSDISQIVFFCFKTLILVPYSIKRLPNPDKIH